jgi:hypothetical protein
VAGSCEHGSETSVSVKSGLSSCLNDFTFSRRTLLRGVSCSGSQSVTLFSFHRQLQLTFSRSDIKKSRDDKPRHDGGYGSSGDPNLVLFRVLLWQIEGVVYQEAK